MLTQEHGGPTEELVSEENGPLISMLLRQYFMALKTFDKWKHSSPSMDKQWSKIVSSVAETHPTMEPAKVQEPAAALPPPAVGVTFKPCYNEGGDSEKQGGAENKSMAKWENWTAHKVRQRQASLRPFDETSDASSAPRRPSTTLLRKRSSSKGDTTAAARAAALVQQEMSAPMSSLAVVDESPYDERSQPQHEESQEAKDLRLFDEQKRLMRKYMAKWMRIVGVTPKACDEITPEEAADVDWTRAVAPRVEGRIRNVRAKPEEG